jgi:hypothetical protein
LRDILRDIVARASEPSSLRSLSEAHGTIPVPVTASFWRKLAAFAGPGYLVAVGYMDQGNWATDLAGLGDLLHGSTATRGRHDLGIPVLLLKAAHPPAS